MKFHVLASGSKGNATLVQEGNNLLLIDMGVNKCVLIDGLEKINKKMEDINAAIFTHDHSDHIKGINFINKDIIYATVGTTKLNETNIIEPYEKYNIAGFEIMPLQTSHDATNPVGYIINGKKSTLVYITDTGYISERNLNLCKDKDFYIIESNHNVRMLLKSNRPQYLKERILSDVGHLSNEDSAVYMSEIIGKNTKQIFLAHLSEECNTPELALSAYLKIFRKRRINVDLYQIRCLKQYECVSGGDIDED